MRNGQPLAIGKAHRRALTSRLCLLDEMLAEFEGWAGGEAAGGVLFAVDNELSAEQREDLAREVRETRRLLEEMREDCGLRVERRSVRQALLSRCALLHEMLTELEPRYLRRYGAMDEEAADYLEEKVGGLQERVEALRRSARRRG